MYGRTAIWNKESLVKKQPIFVSKRNSLEKETSKFLIALGGFLYKVWIVLFKVCFWR